MPKALQPGETVVLMSKDGSYIAIKVISEKLKDDCVVYSDGCEMKHKTINKSTLEKNLTDDIEGIHG